MINHQLSHHSLSHHPLSHHPLSHHPLNHHPLSYHPRALNHYSLSHHPLTTLSHHPLQPEFSHHPCAKQTVDESNEQCLSIQDSTNETTGDSWCYCRKSESNDHMIGCDNAACLIQWFHLSCLHLTLEKVPKGKWLCPECRHLKNKHHHP